ncbi:hypothetical protein BGW38_002962 [Lunasporangiospora selenospora]|uniref:Ribosome biogenesis protein SLX9 n=1 Tax=Lunasporangiospora selenospora TaxID=979761 RepID=A0A9P6FS18_9FUNG|nr:hypothetical protein BGW38_002962 [Lunasporangiospora selenospora]
MPKVKTKKSRVHHKSAAASVAAAGATNADTATASVNAVTAAQLNEQLGLELMQNDQHEKKHDKRKQRHDKWMQKLEATYNPQKKKKKKASAQNQTLSVDFGSFHDALSAMDPSSAKESNKLDQTASAPTGVTTGAGSSDQRKYAINVDSSKAHKSKKAKNKAAMQEILRFQNVLAHPAFKSNPLLTIQQHVKNTMEMAPPEPSTVAASATEDMQD